jgi:hypothetical protein
MNNTTNKEATPIFTRSVEVLVLVLVIALMLVAALFDAREAVTEAAPTTPVACTLVDFEVATNLEASGRDLQFGAGTWTLDGEVIGRTEAEDEDFTACGDPALIAAVEEAQP